MRTYIQEIIFLNYGKQKLEICGVAKVFLKQNYIPLIVFHSFEIFQNFIFHDIFECYTY